MEQKEKPKWYVMRVAKRGQDNSATISELLERMAARGIEVFRPMEDRLVKRAGRTQTACKPILGEMFFAKGLRETIEAFIESVRGLIQFKFQRSGYHNLMVVPYAQMENFMQAVGSLAVKKYYQPGELHLIKKGTRVRVHSGEGNPGDGIVGTFARPLGNRSRCLLVDIPGLLTASFDIAPELLEVVEE